MPLKVRRDGAVLRLVLARAEKRNAFDGELLEALLAAAAEAAGDPAARAVVIEAEGPAFCAGADIAWMRRLGGLSEAENRAAAERLAGLFERLDRLPKPLVGRIQGACVGGGLGLAAVCDVAVASDAASFAAPEVRLGILPAVIGPYVLAKLGLGACRDIFLSGRRFDAAEAQRLGLVQRVAPLDRLDAEVARVLDELLAGGPAAQARIKRYLAELAGGVRRGEPLSSWTAAEIAAARAGEEGRAGLEAHLAGLPPPWARRDDGRPR
jgi:methylglutaconyl-CoA hydratase